MTWEETIEYIRTKPEFRDLVDKAYFEADLPLNVERFRHREEFKETLKLLRKYAPQASSVLDVGSGNGISAIAFALVGYRVTAVEPDPSETIGAGAIQKLAAHYHLPGLQVHQSIAEDLLLEKNSMDVVYVRQAMHHAHELQAFVANLVSFLKPGGIFVTIRDHVIWNEADKKWFLDSHPLHKFYGGENAYTLQEYLGAMKQAGLEVVEMIRFFDSIINYFPMTRSEVEQIPARAENQVNHHLQKKLGTLGTLGPVKWLYKKKIGFDRSTLPDERNVPGRMYSFVAVKK
jgi:SAM-dependent methyltransferase